MRMAIDCFDERRNRREQNGSGEIELTSKD